MRPRSFWNLAAVTIFALSLSGCCCLKLPCLGRSAAGSGGAGDTMEDGAGGPTLRAGFVKVVHAANGTVLAYYSTDLMDSSVEYWMVEKGNMPIFAMYPDVLKYYYLNEPLVGSAAEMCARPQAGEFEDPEVYKVKSTIGPPYLCPE